MSPRLLALAPTRPAADAYTLTAGRSWSLVAALLGVAAVVVGGVALARAAGRTGTGPWRRGAITAVAGGSAGALIGGLVVAAAEGGPGTGGGVVGGAAALAVGLLGAVLGGLALNRSRHVA